jgi:hypothetical protein
MAAIVKANLDAILPVGSLPTDLTYLTAICNGIVSHLVAAGTVPAGIAATVDPVTHIGATTGIGTIL